MIAPVVSDQVREKAERILTEGRLRVAHPELGLVATVTGETGRYRISRDTTGTYHCSCPVLGDRLCSHLAAFALVAGLVKDAS